MKRSAQCWFSMHSHEMLLAYKLVVISVPIWQSPKISLYEGRHQIRTALLTVFVLHQVQLGESKEVRFI
jgi:hypothetical protein